MIHKVKPLTFATLIPNPCPCPNSKLTHLPQFQMIQKGSNQQHFCISDHISLSLSKLTHLSEFSLMLRIIFASTTFRQPWPTIVCSQCQNYQQCKSKFIEKRVNLVGPFKISHLTYLLSCYFPRSECVFVNWGLLCFAAINQRTSLTRVFAHWGFPKETNQAASLSALCFVFVC